MTKMLLVSHEASLTGAPRVAANLLEAAIGVVGERVVLIRWPGPLRSELTRTADRERSEPLRRTRVLLRRFKRTRSLAVKLEVGIAKFVLAREKPDLVYLNTVKSACYVRPALESGCRVILHSHELGSLASDTLQRYHLEDAYEKVRLVACSEAARDCLAQITGDDAITVIHSTVDAQRVTELASIGQWDLSRGAPDLPVDQGLVVACGTADRRKGTDLWLQMAQHIRAQRGAAACPSFVWIGEDVEGFRNSLDQLGLANCVRFVGATSNPYPIIAAADLVTVPSRQDAFPLSVFEAMSLGKPIVAFDVGGIRDQVGDAGVLVPPANTIAMAEAVGRLLDVPGERAILGKNGSRRVREVFGITKFREAAVALIAGELEAK